MSRARTNEDRDTEILRAYTAGKTLEQVAHGYGISRERVRQILERQGVNRRSTSETVDIQHRRLGENRRGEILDVFAKLGTVKGTVAHFAGDIPSKVVRAVLREIPQEQRYKQRPLKGRTHTDQSILDAVLRAESEGVRTIKAYREWRESNPGAPSVPLLVMRYGSWRNTRTAAGLKTVVAGDPPRTFTDDDIAAAVNRFVTACRAAGRYPSARAYLDWSRKVGLVPGLSTLRSRTNMRWIEIVERFGGGA